MQTKKKITVFTVLTVMFFVGFIVQYIILQAIRNVDIGQQIVSVSTGTSCGIGIFTVLFISLCQIIYVFVILPFRYITRKVVGNVKTHFEPMSPEDRDEANRNFDRHAFGK